MPISLNPLLRVLLRISLQREMGVELEYGRQFAEKATLRQHDDIDACLTIRFRF